MGFELVFVVSPADVPIDREGRRYVVTDESWTAPGSDADVDGLIAVRGLIVTALSGRDLLAESLTRLDGWAEGTGVVEASTVDGLSAWYHRRLHLWRWLHERLAWLAVVDLLLADGSVSSIVVPAAEASLGEVAGLAAAARGLEFRIDSSRSADKRDTAAAAEASRRVADDRGALGRLRRVPARVGSAYRRWRIDRRLSALAKEPRRLLVLVSPGDRQVISTPTGPTERNPFLDPVIDALRGTVLDPVTLELGATTDGGDWSRLTGGSGARTLPGELLATRFSRAADRDTTTRVEAAVGRVEAISSPMLVDGVDLGPLVHAELIAGIRGALTGRLRDLPRMRRFLARLRPAGIVLVNEYGRPEWLAAADAEGIPSTAVQHGIIHRFHVGYRYPARTTQLTLPRRTYVFGDYEARLLTGESVYRPEEVAVSGSPRLDLAGPGEPDPSDRARTRAAVRRELGVADGDRLVVVSTTAAAVLTRFGVMPALGRLFDHPLSGVHVVVKLHPAESDGTRYQRLIEGIAAARGIPAPPLTVVKAIDLYRLLAAADAHLGSYSTVLTEATVVGTPNLLAAADAGGDLLDYAAAGVARPVRDGADLLLALDELAGPETSTARASRAAFVAEHFRSGAAAPRIAADLLALLAREAPAR